MHVLIFVIATHTMHIPPTSRFGQRVRAVPQGHTGLGVLDLEQWDPAWDMNNCSFAGHDIYPGDCPSDGWKVRTCTCRALVRVTLPAAVLHAVVFVQPAVGFAADCW